jgi:prepilin-type N-terminal cleavage/methylation domain-containing protein/prepilin-type processing-associated H-X9-DG protein
MLTNHRRRGFTLVELLVVVAIVTILVALLVPALSRAREHVNRVKCAANLRSLGQAMELYVQHYGWYPGGDAAEGPDYGLFAVWPVRLRAFTGGETEVFNCPSQDERCRWTQGALSPSGATAAHVAFGYHIGEPVIRQAGTYFSYGYNHRGPNFDVPMGLGYAVNVPLTAGLEGQVRPSRVRVPEEMIAISDSNADGNMDFAIHPRVAAWYPGTVHDGGANVLYCDGHVQSSRLDDLALTFPTDSAQSSARWAAMARRWRYDHRFGIY